MNRRAATGGARDKLERDLIGSVTSKLDMFESGKDQKTPLNQKQFATLAAVGQRAVQQGWRRRHPTVVLNQYAGVMSTTDDTYNQYEKHMAEEHQTLSLPDTYTSFRSKDMMATQVGLVNTALENYKHVKSKLSSVNLASV